MHVEAVAVTLGCFIDCVELVQHLSDVHGLQVVRRCLMLHCEEALAVNMWSSAQLTRPKGESDPCRSHLYPRQGYPSFVL